MNPQLTRGFLRFFLGILAVFFAFNLGRAIAHKRRVFGWALRTTVTLLAVFWGHPFDWQDAVVIGLTLLAAAGGYFQAIRPKHEEDLVGKMFD